MLSIFDLFSIGIGPSSSHTVGPMRAALAFVNRLPELKRVARIRVDLYGSLGLTGAGHGTDKAIVNGLEGTQPDTCDPEALITRLTEVALTSRLQLGGTHLIEFALQRDLVLHPEFLTKHSNGMRFTAYDQQGTVILTDDYYSTGGGFIVTDAEFGQESPPQKPQPFPFNSAAQLLQHCHAQQLTIAEIMLANESVTRAVDDIYAKIKTITNVMSDCIAVGCRTKGTLPGGLNVRRRAAELHERLTQKQGIASSYEQADVLNHLNMYALAVNEVNAAGGRVVTAPTNGAAGIIPSVIEYYKTAHAADDAGLYRFFLTAGAIGILYKKNASISGAEVGCQGEVGSASSMAAAGLTAALGGTPEQVENAAEIAMEHHLGMTCDPINGLVQIPCIERNAMGAVKAVNAARMALIGDGQHKVSLDKVIDTMWATGRDMNVIYKETSLGGLAVNIIEC